MFGRKIISFKNSLKRNRSVKTNNTVKAKTQTKAKTRTNNYLFTGIVIVLILAFLSLSIPISLLFYNFDTYSSYNSYETEKWDFRDKFKVLLVGVDKKEGNNTFVDGLALLVVHPDNDETSIININPDILVYDAQENKPVALRRALVQGDDDIEELIGLTEELLATKIDRYFLVNEDFLKATERYTKSMGMSLAKEVNDPDIRSKMSWDKGQVRLSSCCIYEFLQADSNGRDDQLYRQLELYRGYTRSVDILKIMLDLKDVLEIIETKVDTNLSKLELLVLFNYLKSVPPASYNTVYTKSDYLNNIGKAGVYEVFSVNYPLFDHEIDIILRDKNVQLEQAIVEVQNASGVGGLASKKSRWIANMGGEIAHVANAPYPEERTKIYIGNFEQYPNTIKQLRKIFPENADFIESEYQYRHIGKIVVVIGKQN